MNFMDYMKIGKATELEGTDRRFYRALEILPGFLSWFTLLILLVLSYFTPVGVAFFVIAFDVYWLLLVTYLSIHLLAAYRRMKANVKVDWRSALTELGKAGDQPPFDWREVIHLLILPTYKEGLDVVRPCFQAIVDSGYPLDKVIAVFAVEERGGPDALIRAEVIKKEFGSHFRNFMVTVHPADIPGELKGKGSNQSWAAKQVKKEVIDAEGIDYDKILVSVFDIDTVIYPQYLHLLTYKFLTVENRYRASYQPIPIYHNNIWQAPFFARVAASSNTFWQMMQQIRQEKLATYSSHSMTWRALNDINFWSVTMVSEDSRIFWHCFCHYRGDYRVEPLNYPVSMDVCMDDTLWATAKNLYKQQRRWGWGVENIPYLIFNTTKLWREIPKGRFLSRIFVQVHGFHSWATNALIIAVIGWMPILLGGDRFNATVLSTNLPALTRTLMTIAMFGLVLSAILSTMLLPRKPKNYGIFRYVAMAGQWVILPISIIVFGSFPGLEAQTRLMLGKYLGFWVTPKARKSLAIKN